MNRGRRADEIVGRCRERLDRGERVDPDEVLREHPDLAEILRPRLMALAMLASRSAPTAGRARTSLVGATLGPYRLVAELGDGGMGRVYEARVEGPAPGLAPGDVVAVKVVRDELAARPGFLDRFRREGEIGSRVRHANVVRTLEAGEAALDDRVERFLVMEHVEGRTLHDLQRELGRAPETLCRHVGREIARGLTAIHAAGAVHRDLKPDNVLVTADHVVKVMDLGVARLADGTGRLSQPGAFVGSFRYAAPEQFSDPATVDGRTDLHALGLVLYELATGVHPFEADEFGAVVRKVLDVVPPRAGAVNPQLSPFFEELVAHLLEKEKDRRPATAADVAAILDEGERSAWWKGRAESIRRETRRPLRRIRIPRETSLHGREAEIALLRERFARASAGDGQVVLVEGEAGIGKSRLVDEFVLSLWAAGQEADFLFGSYPPGGAATVSGAFSTAYREHLGDDEAAVRDALPQTPLLVPAFAALLRGDVAPEHAEKLTKDSLQTVFVHATRSFAARRPTIVFIDDLHFAPEEGRGLFASLALAVPGHRILLVGGTRPTLDEKWAAGVARLPHVTRVALPRLGSESLVRLLEEALTSKHLAEDLSAKIATKSDGNPFFVFEILRSLRDGKFLTRTSDGTWITTKEIREIEVPPSVVELIQARVSDFSREDRDVLEVAACVGFEFDARLVGDVLGVSPIPLLQRLGAIEKQHRLVRSVGRRFAFDHHQVQEVLYAALSAALHEAYHAKIAEALEVRSGAAVKDDASLDGALCVELAEHLLKGARGERALRYLDVALTHLERSYINNAAVRLADQVLSAPGLLAGRRRCEVLLRKAERLKLLGRTADQATSLQEANALADAVGDAALRSRALRALGNVLIHQSRLHDARSKYEEAMSISRELGDRRAETISTNYLGTIAMDEDRYDEARALLERHLETSREIDYRQGEAAATGNLGTVFRSLGRYDEARTHHERCLALYREVGDRRGEATAMGNLGSVLFDLGRIDEARSHFERALVIVRETGDRRGEAIVTGNLANVAAKLVTSDAERVLKDRCLAIHREIGNRDGEALALVNLATLWERLGDMTRAQEALTEALKISREIGNRAQEGLALEGLGGLAENRGDDATALQAWEAALALHRAIGYGRRMAALLLASGELRGLSGDQSGARAAFDEAVAIARAQGDAAMVALGLAILACLPGGDADAAVAAHATIAPADDTPLLRFYLWRATGNAAHLVEAKRIVDLRVAHAPPEFRESMLTNVRLHREVVAAAREQGIA
jgi:serine/threonine protein kinase/tetratricopeptide (TPR) repeat protein